MPAAEPLRGRVRQPRRESLSRRAGHPPPLLLGGPGSRHLEGAGGPVLGVTGRAPFTEDRTWIEPGSSILLYTDNLVERRTRGPVGSRRETARVVAPRSAAHRVLGLSGLGDVLDVRSHQECAAGG